MTKYCLTCGKEIGDKNKRGYCIKHYPRTGADNPFYGKTHTKEVREILKVKCAEGTRKKWEDEEYRNKVISGATGKKRGDDFKETQRKNALKQFNDPEQRRIRAEKMKESWATGKIVKTKHPAFNKSKQEKLFFEMLLESYNGNIVLEETLHYVDEFGKSKYLFPDGILKDEKIILEYNGSFWHADKRFYKADDIMHHNITAKEIWEIDNKKKLIYESLGYKVLYIWSKDFLKKEKECIENVINQIKELLNE